MTKKYLKEVPFNLDGHPRGTVLLRKDNKVVVKFNEYDTEAQLNQLMAIHKKIYGNNSPARRGYHLCGYVAIPKAKLPKSWHGNYDAPGLQYLNIHGGITYAEMVGSYCIFGLDCAHAGDDSNEQLFDPVHVMELVEQMEDQIMTFADMYADWYEAIDADRVKMLDTIRDRATIKEEVGMGAMIDMLSGAEKLRKREKE